MKATVPRAWVGAIGSFNFLGPKQDQIAQAAVKNGAEWMFPIGFGQKENLPYESYGPPGLGGSYRLI